MKFPTQDEILATVTERTIHMLVGRRKSQRALLASILQRAWVDGYAAGLQDTTRQVREKTNVLSLVADQSIPTCPIQTKRQ